MCARLSIVGCLVFALILPAGPASSADESGQTLLLRFPDIHRDFVVFVYAGDIWRAPTTGGAARRLTSHSGLELFPQISPDGAWVAFTAEYTGSRQVFVMPSAGGASRQLTYYNDVGQMPPRGGWDNWIQGWTPDGKILVRMNRTPWGKRMGRHFLVDPQGGLETPLELPEGGSASLSPDGRSLAYAPVSREFRTWKRTRGGRAQDIWIFDLEARQSKRMTDSRATENFPMWHGETIYFTSDRDHTLNLYAQDLGNDTVRRLTEFDEFDVLWPSLGPESIVFMNGGRLHRHDLESGRTRPLSIRIESDLPLRAPHFKDVSKNVSSASLSPSGSRVIVEARGELFSVPAKKGPTRNLSRTGAERERDPAWSPDGMWIAYLSDRDGDYELYIRAADGTGEPRRLTDNGGFWRFQPVWSPDSSRLAFSDRGRRLWILEIEGGELTEVDRETRGDLRHYSWSADSRWLAYEKSHPTRSSGIAVYSLESARRQVLGDGLTADYEPVFSSDGEHLFFLSDRDFNLEFSSFEFNYVYQESGRVYAAALDPAADALFPLESDEETAEEETSSDDSSAGDTKKKKRGKKNEADEADSEPQKVLPEGWTARTIAIPGLPPGDYRALSATEDALYYIRAKSEAPAALYRFDLEQRKEEKVLDGVLGYELSADGKKLLYVAGSTWGVAEAKAGLSENEGKLDLSELRIKLDPAEEWKQIYRDAVKITRDWFYDPAMHGKDWEELSRRYETLLPDVAHRADLDFVLGELIGELDAGHTYVGSGDEPEVARVEGGMLGCEFEADASGRFRIGHIFAGENWDSRYRSPLTEPGVDVSEGQFLLGIDGVSLSTGDNPYRLLEGKAGRQVMLELADSPQGSPRSVTVVPVSSELELRYLDWVKSRMALTDRLSGGRIGYIHLPDTAFDGNRMLQKLFYSQVAKPALIVDDRYNGGGFIPDRMIEYLTRRTLVWWAQRDIDSMRTPNFAHDGPKAMLINGYSSSGGDALPYFFRQNELGPLIGTRTWGGLIGLTGNPGFVDGGAVRIPSFRIYDRSGAWVVENEGVEPDIEVVDLPEARIAGHDPSLERAIELLLEQLSREPGGEPRAPQPPNMGRSTTVR